MTESCYFGFVAKEKAVALLFLYFYHMISAPLKKLSEFNTIFGEFFFFLDKFRKCCDMQNLKKKFQRNSHDIFHDICALATQTRSEL